MYLIIYAVVIPPVCVYVVNKFIISRKCMHTPLSLLRGEVKAAKEISVPGRVLSFNSKFRLKEFFAKKSIALAMLFAIFIAIWVMMIGINCYYLCMHIKTQSIEDTKYNYLYTLKYPPSEAPEGTYEAYLKGFKKEAYGYNLDVTLVGITNDNPFFDVELPEKKNEVVVGSAVAQKYNVSVGDIFVLADEENGLYSAFKVADIVSYAASFYVFMDIDNMRDVYETDDDFYNAVFSDEEADIPSGIISGIITKEGIDKASGVFVSMMEPMIILMGAASTGMFIVVLYLMIKLMLDESADNIAMLKVLGYRLPELKSLYLRGNLLIVIASTLVSIPLAKVITNAMFPYMIANVACGMDLSVPIYVWVIIVVSACIIYFIVEFILLNKIKRITPARVIKG